MALDVIELCSINTTFNPLVNSFVQISLMLVIAHLFNLIFKPLGQPGPINQMLAGLVLSPSFLSRINKVREYFIQDLSAVYYRVFAFISRVLFMFLIGLEMDIAYMRTNFRLASTIAAGGFLLSIVFGIPLTLIFKSMYGINGSTPSFFFIIIILLANSASPVVMRLIDDLKFSTSDLGRLATTASLINEVSCILCYSIYIAVLSGKNFLSAFYVIGFTTMFIFINKHLAKRFVKWNKDSKYVSNAQVLLLLMLVVSLAFTTEICGYNSTLTGFLLGVFFPRDGKTTRTLFKKLAYSINNFVLPIYFGYMAFQCDTREITSFKDVILLLLMFFSSFACKIIGTLAVCRHLKIPRIKGVLLAFILNLKGNFELLLIDVQDESQAAWWSPKLHRLLLIVIVWNTLFSGPIIADILRRRVNYFAHTNTSIEPLNPEAELRILHCAYEPRHATGQLVLTAALSSSITISPYLMHLVELPKKRRKTNLMYNQLEDGGQYSDEEDYGGNDVLDINEAVDALTAQTHIRISQTKIVNTFANMYEDVCNGAEDFRVSVIFLPFHKHQRIDKIMENSKEGYRTTNQKILRHAPCSVGVLVHKNQTGFQLPVGGGYNNNNNNNERAQHAAMLFFGGADDREALALSKRIAKHSNINLTVIRFLIPGKKESASSPLSSSGGASSSHIGGGVLMSLSRNHEIELAKDNAFFEEFRLRYVVSGQAAMMERYVSNGIETRQVLWEIFDSMECSLYIVGKGNHGGSVMTTGLSDWEECPELGPVGDLLASSDLDLKSSVLIIQQHRQYTNDHDHDHDHGGSVDC